MASSAYIAQAENGSLKPNAKADVEFLLMAMEAIGKQHAITMAFLRQVRFDIQRAGLDGLRIPKAAMVEDNGLPDSARSEVAACGQNIPLFARSRVSRTGGIMSPLPGRLPLKNPMGKRTMYPSAIRTPCPVYPENNAKGGGQTAHASTGCYDWNNGTANANKRRRISDPSPEELSTGTTPQESSLLSGSDGIADATSQTNGTQQFRLPHRGGSSTDNSSPSESLNTGCNSNTTRSSSGFGPSKTSSVLERGIVLTDQAMDHVSFAETRNQAAAQTQATGNVDLNMFPNRDAATLYAPMTENMLEDDNWMMLNNASGGGGSVHLSWLVGGDPGVR